jgi:HK97 gp10 family phage protein
MSSLELELLNLPEFEARLAAARAGMSEQGETFLEQVAEHIVQDAQAIAPVLAEAQGNAIPGELRDSIQWQRDRDDVLVGSFGTRYAAYVEFGTSKMAAQPWLRPALAAIPGVHFNIRARGRHSKGISRRIRSAGG